MMNQTKIILFAKVPIPGQVKTRLAEVYGEHKACALAEALLLDSWEMLSRLSGADVVLATNGPLPTRLGILPEAVWDQGKGDLGERLERMIQRALTDRPQVICLGADSPALPPDLLLQASDALLAHDAVLGPAEDGGFYLLGLKKCATGLLGDLPWSTDHTFDKTHERLVEQNLSVALLPAFFDMDRPGDLETLARFIDQAPEVAPRTRQWLQMHHRPLLS